MARKGQDRPHWSEPEPIENIGAVQRRFVKRRYSRQLIDETIEVWQPYYEVTLTDEDACEIIQNMSLFVGALLGFRKDLLNRAETSPESD